MLNFASIGTSMITDNLIEASQNVENVRFVGTMSRNAERAREFTLAHGGTQPFTSIEELCACPELDAVYIASPNALHASQALACIEAGKHVLVEKPLGANKAEAQAVFEAAEKAGVVALEAMRPLHDPAFRACQDALSELGPIRRASLRFGKYSSRYDELLAGRPTNIFSCNMASGALMDIGVYTVEPMVELFGVPERIAAVATLLPQSTQELTQGPLDGCGSVLAQYPDFTVELSYSKISNDLLNSQVEGEAATLNITGISTPSAARINYRGIATRNAAKAGYSEQNTCMRELSLPVCNNTMEYELADFAAAVENARMLASCASIWDTPCGAYGTLGHFRTVTLASLGIMDEIRHQTSVVFAADKH